ncbi:topoisomerase II-associated deadenylation- dependent mRNA-decapping factor [Schizosaccharomyces japonicus yFS275]|uniref:Topoisomerase II-associated deadenylation-dependent mRNA-decapping factor n=1 Tax=Schizosaccharomyces japonicus (strain yFS275 / FY16936) TaxID=402676 RepID=B6K1V3_SCHJY|nr:topoisomerase II-associated deadenylation- dependent mRNA-decapping factor [Schizosaccharomyces japonicus yFS275]EEB07134.1 topoisomerase II-associated deadenylation- dependent mRNA-decapping factor [Schizosaccharomyces japonicus yFS275]
MSFFGFDVRLPRDIKGAAVPAADEEGIDFEDTYDDLAANLQESGDDLNDETFGMSVEGIGRDFDFSGETAQAASKLEAEQLAFEDSRVRRHAGKQPALDSGRSDSSNDFNVELEKKLPELQPMASIWENIAPAPVSTHPGATQQPKENVLSVEQLEAQILASRKPENKPDAAANLSPNASAVPPPVYLTPGQSAAALAEPNYGLPPPPMGLSHLMGNAGPEYPDAQAFANMHIGYPPVAQQYGNQQAYMPNMQITELLQRERMAQAQMQYLKQQHVEKTRQLIGRCAGLMTNSDKSFITRIQLSQLVSEDPSSDDFYYRVYMLIRGRKPSQEDANHFVQTYLGSGGFRRGRRSENPMQKVQQQLLRLVAAAKERPKTTQLFLEGALGKIAFNTVRTPRQLLNVKRPSEQEVAQQRKTHFTGFSSPKDILGAIEHVYDDLLNFEQTLRKGSSIGSDPNTVALWKNEVQTKLDKLRSSLHLSDEAVTSTDQMPPFLSMAAYSKGMRILPRLFPHLSIQQQRQILSLFYSHIDSLKVVKNGTFDVNGELPPGIAESIQAFTQYVLPSILNCVNEADLHFITSLFLQVLRNSNLTFIIQTRVGVSFLTMLISRAETLKQAGTSDPADVANWDQQFNVFFNAVTTHFSSVFPPPNARAYADDSYPWEFLASCAAAASSNQHFTLVSETRDRVLDNIITSRRAPPEIALVRISNVNLFLNAMGLDAKQLNA